MQEAFTVVRVGAKVNHDKRVGNLGRGRRAGQMYGRSYGNVRELIVSGRKEPPTGTAGYKRTGLFPNPGGKRGQHKEVAATRKEGQLTSTVKRRKTKQDGMGNE
jgi:hypothetical protein